MHKISDQAVHTLAKNLSVEDSIAMVKAGVLNWERPINDGNFADAVATQASYYPKSGKDLVNKIASIKNEGGTLTNNSIAPILKSLAGSKDFNPVYVKTVLQDIEVDKLEIGFISWLSANQFQDKEEMTFVQKNVVTIAQALIEAGADLDSKTLNDRSVWEEIEDGNPQGKAYKVFMQWADSKGLKPGVGSLEKVRLVKEGVLMEPTNTKVLSYKRDFIKEERAILDESLLKKLERELTDEKSYSVAIYKVPKKYQPDLGKFVGLFTNQGAWSGAASYENYVAVGSLDDMLATAKEFLVESGVDCSKLGQKGSTLDLHPMNALDTVSDNDYFTLSGAKIGKLVIYQHGDNGIGIVTKNGYNNLLEVTQAAHPEFERFEADDLDLNI